MSCVRRSPPTTPQPPATEPHVPASETMEVSYVNVKRGSKGKKSPTVAQPVLQASSDTPAQLDDQASQFQVFITKQTAEMKKLLAEVAAIKSQNAEILKTNERIEYSMNFINEKFEEITKEVTKLKRDQLEQKTYIESLEQKIQDLQYKSRSSGIEIRSIPQDEKETEGALIDVVCAIGQTVGSPISQDELRDIYRLPGKAGNGTPRPIVAEFTAVRKQQKLLSAVRVFNGKSRNPEDRLNTTRLNLKGPLTSVNVSERLPASTKKLLYLSSEFKKKYSFNYCWVKNGIVYLRRSEGEKHYLIKSELCLKKLEKELTNKF